MKKIYSILATILLVTSGQIMGQASSQNFPSSGTFVVPAGWQANVTIEMWGGGAGGGDLNADAQAGGGAGGYAKTNLLLLSGSYDVVVGTGGAPGNAGGLSSFSLSTTTYIIANGGGAVTSRTGGTGGSGVVNSGSNKVTGTGGNGGSVATNSQAGAGGGASLRNSGTGNSGQTVGSGNSNGLGGAGFTSPLNSLLTGNGGAGTQKNSTAAAGSGSQFGGGGGGKGQNSTGASGSGGNGYVIVTVTSSQAAPLPVSFGAIKAAEKGTGVQIDWTSYSELNIANYQIERSADGIHFTSVGEVAPRNVSDASNYTFFDALPLSGTSFYRIRNNDIDGKSGLSNIVKINLNKNIKTISVYPNPIRGNRVSFQTSDLVKGTYNVEVINAFGARVFQQSVNHAGGAINQSLSLPNLQSGSYTLRINGTSTSSTHKITILQ